MFERRNQRSRVQKVKEVFLPTMGWKRMLAYIWLRLKRISVRSSIHSVAAGLSVGWAISFNPMVGTHLLWMIPMSWITGANYIASVIGSLVGNIWTFPAFFYVSYKVGNFALSLIGLEDGVGNIDAFADASEKGIGELFLTTLLGWPIMAVLSYGITYYPNYYLVKYLRRAYRRAIEKMRAKKQASKRI